MIITYELPGSKGFTMADRELNIDKTTQPDTLEEDGIMQLYELLNIETKIKREALYDSLNPLPVIPKTAKLDKFSAKTL